MKKRLFLLMFAALIPTIVELLLKLQGNYFVGLFARIVVLVFVPIIAVSLFTKGGLKESFLVSLRFDKKKKKDFWFLTSLFSIGAVVVILLALFIFRNMLDFSSIAEDLAKINVNSTTYIFVALTIALVNPFLEEYFWRGFVFRVFDEYTPSFLAYSTGILFALHHMLIFREWFIWWQFLIVTVFLAAVGILFNYMYKRTGSIYASLIVHFIADIVIVLIGWFLVF